MTTWIDLLSSAAPVKRTFATPPALERLMHLQTLIRARGVDVTIRLEPKSALLREEVKKQVTLGLVDLEFRLAGVTSLRLASELLCENRTCSLAVLPRGLILFDEKGVKLLEAEGDSPSSVTVLFPSH